MGAGVDNATSGRSCRVWLGETRLVLLLRIKEANANASASAAAASTEPAALIVCLRR